MTYILYYKYYVYQSASNSILANEYVAVPFLITHRHPLVIISWHHHYRYNLFYERFHNYWKETAAVVRVRDGE